MNVGHLYQLDEDELAIVVSALKHRADHLAATHCPSAAQVIRGLRQRLCNASKESTVPHAGDIIVEALEKLQRAVHEHYQATGMYGQITSYAIHPSGYHMSVEARKPHCEFVMQCFTIAPTMGLAVFNLIGKWLLQTGSLNTARAPLETLYKEQGHLFK